MLDRFTRVTKTHPCPICGKPDWCMVSTDGQVAICPRTSEGAVKYVVDAGYLHKLVDRVDWPMVPPRHTAPPVPDFDAHGFARRCHDAIREDDLDMLGEQLGVSPESLIRLRTGWSEQHGAYTFPMRSDRNDIIGIRLRSADGHKWAVSGSRAGLFIPAALTSQGPLLICEGPTDTAALLSLGFDAIGRPSCTGGTDYLFAGLRRHRPRRAVVIVADRDGPGWKGATTLAQQIIRLTSSLKIITPVGVKDAREWVRRGVSATLIRGIINATSECQALEEVQTW